MEASKNSKYFLYGSILLFLIVAYFAIQAAIKNRKPTPIEKQEDFNDGKITDVTAFNPRPLTDELFQDIYEIVGVRNMEPYKTLNTLSNTNMVKVMNDWDDRYYAKDKETLYEAIDREIFPSTVIIDNLMIRLKTLEQLRK